MLNDVLKALAEVGLAVSSAEEAVAEGRPREAAALLDEARSGLPRVATLSVGLPEVDPEEELDPAGA